MILRISAVSLLMLVGQPALAEGGCPPGQYPYETPQARQCVPIPGAGGSGSAQPSITYQDRWGAVAKSPDAPNVGVSVDQVSKRKATSEALKQCASRGAKDCQLVQAFRNQCAAIASGGGFRGFAFDEDKAVAQKKAIEACSGQDAVVCEVAWSDCSLPVRVR